MRTQVGGGRKGDGSGGLRGNRIARQGTDWVWRLPRAAGQRLNQFLGWVQRDKVQFGNGQHAILMRHSGGAQ